MKYPPPPPGFELVSVEPTIPPPPPGFELDNGGAGRFAQPNMAASAADFNSPRRRADREVAGEDMGAKPLAFGIPIVGPYLEEGAAVVASLPATVAEGVQRAVGIENPVRPTAWPTYEQSLERMRARNRKAEADRPVQDLVGQLAAGVVTGGPLLSRIPVAASLPGRIAQGAALGGGIGAVQGFGAGEGGIENRLGTAAEQGTFGAVVGAVAPPVIEAVGAGIGAVGNALTPTFARWGQNLRNMRGAVDDAGPQPMSVGAAAVGAPPVPPPGTALPLIRGRDAAADQIIANQLARANLNTTDVRQRLALARQANEIAPGQPIPNAMALVDVDPSLQRLAGSVSRQQPEAGNIARGFIAGRQTGITPRDGIPYNAGIATRPAFSQPVPGQPMGQNERVSAALRDALEIPQGSAYAYGKALTEKMRAEAKAGFGAIYKDADAAGLDVRPFIQPVLDQWKALARNEPREVAKAIDSALRMYSAKSGTIGSLQRFQKAKEFLDVKIGNYFKSVGDNKNEYLGKLLSNLQRDLRNAVDAIPVANIGARYAAARQQFATDAELKKAIDLGRKAFQSDSEVTADIYNALNFAQQRVFRLGLYDANLRNISGPKNTNDITQIFDSPRVQQLLQVVMPPDRAKQFGRFLQTEKGFISTRNEVLGNSKTAERLADDQSFEQMSSLVEQLRSTRSLRDAAFNTARAALDRLFGFRADTAEVIARRLFTADPRELDTIIQRLEQRLGPNRAEQFRRMLAEQLSARVGAAATVAAPPSRRPTE